VLVAALGSRALFVVAAICWVQNILLPWWYTERWIGDATALSLVLVKDLLLLFLVGYAAWRARWARPWGVPAPIVWLLAYGAWATLRVGFGVALAGEPLVDNLRVVRGLLFPVEAVLVGFFVALIAPRVPARYVRFTVAGILVCAVVSLGLYVLPSEAFWLNHVNIANYNLDVKGDVAWTVVTDLGIPESAVARTAFQALSAFRLLGTFGDPLTAGLVIGLAALALAARPQLGPRSVALGLPLAAALFLTFSRSAWLLAAVGFAYLAVVQRRPGRLGLLFGGAAVLWIALAPLRQFVATSLAAFDVGGLDSYHAAGITNFYSATMLRPDYLLGIGVLGSTGRSWVLENGLAYITVQFGVPALVTFVGLCLSAERYLRRHALPEDLVARLGAACALASLVVMNFCFYSLWFTAYFGIWTIVGLGIGALHRGEIEATLAAAPAAAHA
jgi:hypothetical protein